MLISTVENLIGILRGFPRDAQIKICDYRHDDNPVPENIVQIAKSFGIEVVPVIMFGTLYEAIEFVKTKPKSMIGTADMEGLVCKPAVDMLDRQGNRIIVKVKVKDFL